MVAELHPHLVVGPRPARVDVVVCYKQHKVLICKVLVCKVFVCKVVVCKVVVSVLFLVSAVLAAVVVWCLFGDLCGVVLRCVVLA